MRVRYTKPALADLSDSFDYVCEHNPAAALDIVDAIEASIKNLPQHPRMGREGRWPDTRELIVPGTDYIVAYEIGAGEIIIIGVIHGAKRWPNRNEHG